MHKSAFGLALKSTNETSFLEKLHSIEDEVYKPYKKIIDLEISFEELNKGEILNNIAKLEPFGQENPPPFFYTRKCKIANIKTTERHSFITFENQGASVWDSIEIQANLFNYIIDQEFRKGDIVDIIYSINSDYSINIDSMKHNLSSQIEVANI